MPINTINGWTSAGLLPSYTVLSQILGSAGGTQTQAGTPPPATPATPAPPTNPLGTNIPVGKGGGSGFGGGGGGSNSGFGGGSGAGGRSAINPNLNPQEAYSQYLQNRALLEGSTPQQSALNIAYYQHQLLNDSDPSGLWQNPDAGQIGRPQDSYLSQLKFQSDLANRMFQTASPYSYEQGVAPANAPSAPPANGYTSGWTNSPGGSGFGGFGF